MQGKKTRAIFGFSIERWIDSKIGKLNSQEIFEQILKLCIFLAASATVGNIILNLGNALIMATLFITLFFSLLYFFSHYKGYYPTSVKIFVASQFLILNVLWLTNGGSYGPTLLIFQAFIPMFIFFTELKRKLLIVFLLFVNVHVLFALEYFFPQLIRAYPNPGVRLFDTLVITFLFFIVEIPLLYFIQKQFIAQSLQAINSEKVKSAFLANMSHEIRTPMNAIIGFSELLGEPELDEDTKKQYVNIIKDNGNVLLQIINNIMDASKLESGLIEVNNSNTAIKPMLERLYNSHLPQIPSDKQVELICQVPRQLENITFFTDALLLHQILSNLITNAIKFTDKGYVKFGMEASATTHPEWLRFYVIDSGKGISQKSQAAIFQRFNQGHFNIKDKEGGVGLGLSISNELAQKINGTIELESDGKTGSAFYVILFSHKSNGKESGKNMGTSAKLLHKGNSCVRNAVYADIN
ncbi:sensor histidine kinase [Saccharicrinis carchari]|nr:HAMP domain-containing sensor histidine kinase [Saccharicrinis carchari]